MTIFKESISKYKYNPHWYNRYLKFLNYYNSYDGEGEIHHILPKSLFPEYSNLKKHPWNGIKIPYRSHYLAHYMLAKALGKGMWFAFNMMRRVSNNKSVLYELARKYIKQASSEAMSNRIHIVCPETDVMKSIKIDEKIPEGYIKGESNARRTHRLNKLVVRDKDGNTFQIDKSDSRYINGEVVSYRVGMKHTNETKQKIGIGLRNKIVCNNGTIEKYVYEECVPAGFVKGTCFPRGVHLKKLKDTIFYHDPKTNNSIRIKDGDEIPAGYIKGRGKFENNGFKLANNPNTVSFFNFKTEERGMMNKQDYYTNNFVFSINCKRSLVRFLFENNTIFASYAKYYIYCKEHHIKPKGRKEYYTHTFKPFVDKTQEEMIELLNKYKLIK